MIRLADAITLAYTKLRIHRIRTGLTVGIAGILFGVIVAGVIVVQGVFTSIESFNKEGLNDRSILAVGRMSTPFNVYQNLENPDFIRDVEVRHAELIAKKTAAAKKYGIQYSAATEDPSPISIEKETGEKYIESSDTSNVAVQAVAKEYSEKRYKPFDIDGYLSRYPSARILENNSRVQPIGTGTFEYMNEGKEKILRGEEEQILPTQYNEPALVIMNQSIVESFIKKPTAFQPEKGEIPAIIPFRSAEQLLGLKKLPAKATTQEKYDRLSEVRNRIEEATATFCYRNAASLRLVQEAESQRKDFEKNGTKKGYVAPSVTYKPVGKTDCGPVEVEKDTRTVLEKQLANKYIDYQKELGEYAGEPEQYKVTVRAVGVSKDAPGMGSGSSTFSMSGLVESLLGSWLGYDQWVVPPSLLKEVPEKYRPTELFRLNEAKNVNNFKGLSSAAIEEYMIEFNNKNEARAAMKSGQTSNFGGGEITAYPFGSNALLVAEAKDTFAKVLLWALIGVGGIAMIILGSMIARTVAEGRREGAVFRAIGARRSDIGGIYAMYALLLSLRVAIFALVLGLVLALIVQLLATEDATLGARYAYAAVDTPYGFHFFGLNSWYLLAIVVVILVVGFLGSIIPIIRSVRRNPIKDMRDDT